MKNYTMLTRAIVLIGFSGSGKTSVGTLLAQSLGYTFIDLDTHTERMYQERTGTTLSSRKIYAQFGQNFFYQLHLEAIRGLGEAQKLVISTGGGAVFVAEIRSLLPKLGIVCYLKHIPRNYFRTYAKARLSTFFKNRSHARQYQAPMGTPRSGVLRNRGDHDRQFRPNACSNHADIG
jgi:shikimate kinase